MERDLESNRVNIEFNREKDPPANCGVAFRLHILTRSSSTATHFPRQGHSDSDSKRALLPNIPARAAHIHLVSTTRHHPSLLVHVPIGDISLHEVESGGTLLARCERQLLESSQLLRRGGRGAGGEADVELGNFGSGDGAAVLDIHGDATDVVETRLVTTRNNWAGNGARGTLDIHMESRVCEVGIRYDSVSVLWVGTLPWRGEWLGSRRQSMINTYTSRSQTHNGVRCCSHQSGGNQ